MARLNRHFLMTTMVVLLASATVAIGDDEPGVHFGPYVPHHIPIVTPLKAEPVKKRRKKPMVEWVTPRKLPSDDFINAVSVPGEKQLLPSTLTIEIDSLQYDDITGVALNIEEKSVRIISGFGLNCVSQGNSQNLPPLEHYAIIDFGVLLLSSVGTDPVTGNDQVMVFDPFDNNGPEVGPGPVLKFRSVHGDVRCGTPDRVVAMFSDGFE